MRYLPMSLLRYEANRLGVETFAAFRRFVLAHKFSENQPRDERGRWAAGGHQETGSDTIDAIVERADKLDLANSSNAYQTCLDLCYPLLERFQLPGSDKNTWDFHKCMNLCLGKAQQ